MSPAVRDYLVFQCGWAACVFLGNAGAAAAAAVLLPLQATWPGRRTAREWALVLSFASLGIAVDLGWQAAGIIHFEGALVLGIPPWLVVLWILFAGTLFHSLAFLRERLALAAVLGAAAGPVSYLAGVRSGAATSPHDSWVIAAAMGPAWAVLLPALCFFSRERSVRSVTA